MTPTKREPHRIWPDNAKPIALACIWERWKQPHDAPFDTFAVVTVSANALIAPVHDRMPAVIAKADWPKWLGEVSASIDELKAFLRPCEEALHRVGQSPRLRRPNLSKPICSERAGPIGSRETGTN